APAKLAGGIAVRSTPAGGNNALPWTGRRREGARSGEGLGPTGRAPLAGGSTLSHLEFAGGCDQRQQLTDALVSGVIPLLEAQGTALTDEFDQRRTRLGVHSQRADQVEAAIDEVFWGQLALGP